MPEPDLLSEYLEGGLNAAEQARMEDALQEDVTLCGQVLAHRQLSRLLHALLAGKDSQHRLRESIRAAVHGKPMAELRDAVLAHTSRMPASWQRRVAQSCQESIAPFTHQWATVAAIMAVLVVGTAALFWLLNPFSPACAANLTGPLGKVLVERHGVTVSLTPQFPLSEGDEIHVGADSISIQFAKEATQIVLQPETVVSVTSLAPRKVFQLLQGAIEADVAPQLQGAMEWITDSAEARVLGTRFALTADSTFTRLDVQKGSVELQRRGAAGQTLVRAGQFAASDGQSLLEARPQTEHPIWNLPGISTPSCVHRSFHSKAGGMEMGLNVLLPPFYEKLNGRRFPVLYFLHGFNGNEHTEAARFAPLLQSAMRRGETAPFIIVFPNVGPGHTPSPQVMAQVLAQDLPRFVDESFRTIPFRKGRFLCGVGQGGVRSVLLATLHGISFGGAVTLDDLLHDGPPGFRRLLQRTQDVPWKRDTPLLLLHSHASPHEESLRLGEFLRSLGFPTQSRIIPVPAPDHERYALVAWEAMSPWLVRQVPVPGSAH